MNATFNEAGIAGVGELNTSELNKVVETTVGTYLAQNAWLSELPGVVFGLITLGYLVTSLIALA
jgi:hypothetical protein